MKILKKLSILGCYGNASVDVHVTTTLKCSQKVLEKFA